MIHTYQLVKQTASWEFPISRIARGGGLGCIHVHYEKKREKVKVTIMWSLVIFIGT